MISISKKALLLACLCIHTLPLVSCTLSRLLATGLSINYINDKNPLGFADWAKRQLKEMKSDAEKRFADSKPSSNLNENLPAQENTDTPTLISSSNNENQIPTEDNNNTEE